MNDDQLKKIFTRFESMLRLQDRRIKVLERKIRSHEIEIERLNYAMGKK